MATAATVALDYSCFCFVISPDAPSPHYFTFSSIAVISEEPLSRSARRPLTVITSWRPAASGVCAVSLHFRFRLATDTLALGYVIPAIMAHSGGLTPVRHCSCRAYNRIRNACLSALRTIINTLLIFSGHQSFAIHLLSYAKMTACRIGRCGRPFFYTR